MNWIVPEDYLNEEVRCGHFISAEIKRLWLIELECLRVLDLICKKHGITYYAGGGTLLGAIRHKGFIPWDDDIDVFMNYDEYTRFCRIAPKEIEEPFFFQNYTTEKGFGPGFSRIRNSNSTGCTKYDYAIADESYNCGVFIDIFPLFCVEENRFKRKIQQLRMLFWQLAYAGYERERSLKTRKGPHASILWWHIISRFYTHKDISANYLKACAQASVSGQVGLISFSGFNKRFIWKKKWFDGIVMQPFEFTSIPCPQQYDDVLKTMYGDYQKFVKGSQIHSLVLCDPATPFAEKLKNKFAK